VADEPKPAPVVATSDTEPSTVPPKATVTSSEPATTSKDTIPEPSKETISSSPSSQKEADDLPSDSNLTPKSDGAQATGMDNKGKSESELKAKDQQGDHASPSATPVPKTKVISAPQRSEDDKENVNIVFIGHVDAGKSTIGGHVMLVYISCVHSVLYSL